MNPPVPTCRRRRLRAGITLIECSGTIIAIGMLTTLSLVLLSRSWTAGQLALGHLQKITALEQCIDRLRTDILNAEQVTINGDLQIEQAEFKLAYSVQNQVFERKRFQSGQLVSQESWELPANCEATWALDESGVVKLVTGTLRFRPEQDNPNQVEFDEVAIAARVGGGKNP